jgi:hypothetical protein
MDYLEQTGYLKISTEFIWKEGYGGAGLVERQSILTLKIEVELLISNQLSLIQSLYNHPCLKNLTYSRV